MIYAHVFKSFQMLNYWTQFLENDIWIGKVFEFIG